MNVHFLGHKDLTWYCVLRPLNTVHIPQISSLTGYIFTGGKKIFLRKNWEKKKGSFRGRPIFSESLHFVLDKQLFGSWDDSRMGKPILIKFRSRESSSVCTHSFLFSLAIAEVSTNIAKSPYLLPSPPHCPVMISSNAHVRNFFTEKRLCTPIHHIQHIMHDLLRDKLLVSKYWSH